MRAFCLVLLFLTATQFPASAGKVVESPVAPPGDAGFVRGLRGGVGTNGDGYFAVWFSQELWRGAPVSPDGTLAGDPVVLEPRETLSWGSVYGVAGTGDAWMVSTTDAVTLVRPGEVRRVPVSGGPVVAGGGQFFLYANFAATLVSVSGEVAELPRAAMPYDRSAAWNGQVFAVAGTGGDVYDPGNTVVVNFVGPSGAPRFPQPRPIAVVNGYDALGGVLVFRAGPDFVAVWRARGFIEALRFDDTGQALGEPFRIVAADDLHGVTQAGEDDAILDFTSSRKRFHRKALCTGAAATEVPFANPMFASNGRTVAALPMWNYRAAPIELQVAPLTCSLSAEPATTVPLSLGVADQDNPAIAASAEHAVVVWTERMLHERLRARRLTLEGELREELALPEPLAADASQAWAHVASDGRDFVAVWIERIGRSSLVRAARLQRTGAPPSARTLGRAWDRSNALCEKGPSPQIAWTGSMYHVVWAGEDGLTRLSRLAADGTLLDAEGRVLSAGEPREKFERPRLAVNGTTVLVTWVEADGYCVDPSPLRADGIYGLRLSAEGEPLDPAPFRVDAERPWSNDEEHWGDLQATPVWWAPYWYVIWAGGDYVLRARRIARTGSFVDAEPRVVLRGDVRDPLPMITGAGLALFERGSGSVNPRGRVGRDLEPAGPLPVPLSLQLTEGAVAAAGEGRFLFVGSRVLEHAPYDGAKRVFVVGVDLGDEARRRGARH